MLTSGQIDGHKLHHHPERVSSWLKGQNIFPIYVEVGITSACNHRCIFCALDFTGYKAKSIDRDVMLHALSDMAANGVKSVMFGGEGEPTLHKDFAMFVKHAKDSGLDVALTTNGVPFTRKLAELCLPHLSWLKFSIDAGTPETYAKIHGTKPGDFARLMDNISDAVSIKKAGSYPVAIGTQALLINENSAEIVALAGKMRGLQVDYLAVKPFSQHPDSKNRFSVDYSEFGRLRKQLMGLATGRFHVAYREETMKKLKIERNYAVCHSIPFFTLIDACGNVIPCNLFYGKEDYYYGNLHDSSFSQIWNSSKRRKVLERIDRDGTIKCRENCRLDAINRYLHSLKNPPEHVNFI
ncbi:MAG: radical SAM protein [archaeon]